MEKSQTHKEKITSEIISRLHTCYGIKEKHGSGAHLAEKFGFGANTISGWKKRGVPKEAILTASLETGYKRLWIETGEGPMREPGPAPQVREPTSDYYSPITRKIADMVEAMDEETRKDICLSVEKEKLLRELLRQKESDEKAG